MNAIKSAKLRQSQNIQLMTLQSKSKGNTSKIMFSLRYYISATRIGKIALWTHQSKQHLYLYNYNYNLRPINLIQRNFLRFYYHAKKELSLGLGAWRSDSADHVAPGLGWGDGGMWGRKGRGNEFEVIVRFRRKHGARINWLGNWSRLVRFYSPVVRASVL